LHAAVVIAEHDREALERLFRYGARPAFARERLRGQTTAASPTSSSGRRAPPQTELAWDDASYQLGPALARTDPCQRLNVIAAHHARDLVRQLRRKQSARGTVLAPRTVRHCFWLAHRIAHDAEVDELIDRNPFVLRRGELPGKVDRDPTWRQNAIFTRDEVEHVISDERIPLDRRVVYALLFLAGLRFGEVAALRWRFYESIAEPLGRLMIAHSYNTKRRTVKGTKTEQPRQVPVHRVLANIRLQGDEPGPEPQEYLLLLFELRQRGWLLGGRHGSPGASAPYYTAYYTRTGGGAKAPRSCHISVPQFGGADGTRTLVSHIEIFN
jgi:integrase